MDTTWEMNCFISSCQLIVFELLFYFLSYYSVFNLRKVFSLCFCILMLYIGIQNLLNRIVLIHSSSHMCCKLYQMLLGDCSGFSSRHKWQSLRPLHWQKMYKGSLSCWRQFYIPNARTKGICKS